MHSSRWASQGKSHRDVIAYDNEPPAGPANGMATGEPWVVTARVERAAEVVRRGWLAWETEGEVLPARRAENGANRSEKG